MRHLTMSITKIRFATNFEMQSQGRTGTGRVHAAKSTKTAADGWQCQMGAALLQLQTGHYLALISDAKPQSCLPVEHMNSITSISCHICDLHTLHTFAAQIKVLSSVEQKPQAKPALQGDLPTPPRDSVTARTARGHWGSASANSQPPEACSFMKHSSGPPRAGGIDTPGPQEIFADGARAAAEHTPTWPSRLSMAATTAPHSSRPT